MVKERKGHLWPNLWGLEVGHRMAKQKTGRPTSDAREEEFARGEGRKGSPPVPQNEKNVTTKKKKNKGKIY